MKKTPTDGTILSADQQEYLSSMSMTTTPTTTTPKPAPRHDEETSKTLSWAKQANKATLSKNQELRQRYQETSGEGMSPEDVERAKTLIARDERKRLKKVKTKMESGDETTTPTTLDNKDAQEDDDNTKEKMESETTSMDKTEQDDEDDDETTNETNKKKEAIKAASSSKSKRDKNEALRKRYLETGGEGMAAEQIERAKTLIARDERKRQKNEKKILGSDETTPTLDKDAQKDENTNEKVESSETTSMETTKEDDAIIRKRYLETGGEWMSAEQIKRAKILTAQDKPKKRTNKSSSSAK
jgi:hypothetical protein